MSQAGSFRVRGTSCVVDGYKVLKSKKFLGWIVVTVTCLLLQQTASAARDGVLDDLRSEGSIRISLAILPSLQISVVNQIDIRIENLNVNTDFQEYVCITGHEGGRYNLIAQGGNGDFSLSNADGDRLPYTVHYNGALGGESFDELDAGQNSPTYDLVPHSSQCSQDYNFKITFAAEDLQTVKAGLYTGSLTLLVSPV